MSVTFVTEKATRRAGITDGDVVASMRGGGFRRREGCVFGHPRLLRLRSHAYGQRITMSEDDDGWLFDAWGDGEYTTVDLVLEHVLAQPAPVVDKRWAKLMLATLDTCERSDSMPEEPLGKALAAGAQQMTDAVRARVEELTERFDVELPGGT